MGWAVVKCYLPLRPDRLLLVGEAAILGFDGVSRQIDGPLPWKLGIWTPPATIGEPGLCSKLDKHLVLGLCPVLDVFHDADCCVSDIAELRAILIARRRLPQTALLISRSLWRWSRQSSAEQRRAAEAQRLYPARATL
eukprot:6192678-Pleurochrysis_carterae.AAC.2